MRFFIDTDKQAAFCRDEDYRENGPTECWASNIGGKGLGSFATRYIAFWLANGGRELTAAEFLEETRGTAIADKALEMLAAERGVRCFTDSTHRIWWACGTDRRLCLDDDGHSIIPGWRPNNDDVERQRWVAEVDLRTILSSEPGKKHSKAIEEFILGLPVVGEKPKVECWKRRSTDWVSSFCVDGDWYDISVYDHRQVYQVTSNRPYENAHFPCTLDELIAEYSAYPDIVARIRELTGESVPVVSHEMPVDEQQEALCSMDETQKRGDYALIGVSPESNWPDIEKILHHVSREQAEEELRKLLNEETGATISLRPLGPLIKTLRSVEKTTYEIEEVTG